VEIKEKRCNKYMDLKLTFPPRKGKSPTHTFMDGGTLHVPQDKVSSFSQSYLEGVKVKNHKICLVERCNPRGFNFFVDLDYKNAIPLTEHDVESITLQISRLLGIGQCIVLVSEPRLLDGGDLYKSGIHMVWSHHVVNRQKALEYRAKLIESMGEEWETIIDTSVYRGGLRLPWSMKHQNNKYEKPYLPLHLIKSNGEIVDIDFLPNRESLQLSSIQTTTTTREGWFDKTQMETEIDNPTLVNHIQGFMNANIPGQRNTSIKNLWKQGETGYYLVNTNSRYCENKGGIHRSNHIYFVIDSFGKMYQKCFCTCDHVVRKKGVCSKFRGSGFRLPGTMYRELFPHLV
jgi:hypothetical protein